MPILLCLLLMTFLVGCEAFTSVDHEATQSAEMSVYVAEATAIQAAAQADATRIVGMVQAAETQVAYQHGINEKLHATMRAAVPPTQQLVALGEALATPQAILEGRRWFVKTGMASVVRESDGCIITPEAMFSPDSPRIYATFIAHNIDAGTNLSAAWRREGETVYQDSFTLSRSASEICLWFDIDPSVVEFQRGFWAVQLYADEFPLEDPLTFTISG